jgi:hypothetical protein
VPKGSPEGDERRFIAEIEAQIGVSSEILAVHDDEVHEEDWVTPLSSHGAGLAVVRQVMEARGRLILSGRVGDLVMGNLSDNSVAIFDEVNDGSVWRAMSLLRHWSRACRKPAIEIAHGLMREAFRARFPSRFEEPSEAQRAGAALLSSNLGQTACQREESPRCSGRFAASKHRLATQLLAYSAEARLGVPTPPGRVVYTYPFVHRPLVEFMFASPGHQMSAPGEPRSLMRRAFASFVPPRVLRRQSKGYYPPSAMRAVRPLAAAARPVQRWQVVQRGWIDPVRLDTAIHTLLDGDGRGGYEIQRVLRLEHWLASRDRRAPAVMPKREEVTVHEVLHA